MGQLVPRGGPSAGQEALVFQLGTVAREKASLATRQTVAGMGLWGRGSQPGSASDFLCLAWPGPVAKEQPPLATRLKPG